MKLKKLFIIFILVMALNVRKICALGLDYPTSQADCDERTVEIDPNGGTCTSTILQTYYIVNSSGIPVHCEYTHPTCTREGYILKGFYTTERDGVKVNGVACDEDTTFDEAGKRGLTGYTLTKKIACWEVNSSDNSTVDIDNSSKESKPKTTTTTTTVEETQENPKTGTVMIVIAWLVGIATLCYSVVYFMKVKKQYNE